MALMHEILSRLNNVRVDEVSGDSKSIEVVFPDADVSVFVSQDPKTGRFAASYPTLVHDGRGGWKNDEGFSKDMVSDGVFWILSQVQKHGKVISEYSD